jgi:hypothetical protein
LKTSDVHPSSFSSEYKILKSDNSIEKIKGMVVEIINDLRNALKTRGCRLIGHVKALLYTPSEENLFFSVTSFDEKVHCKGNISGIEGDAKLIINAVVFGVENEKLKTICDDVVKRAGVVRITCENGAIEKWK